jgi:hypothetical protein
LGAVVYKRTFLYREKTNGFLLLPTLSLPPLSIFYLINLLSSPIPSSLPTFTFLPPPLLPSTIPAPFHLPLLPLSQLELARKLEKIAAEKGVQLFLASDVIVADKFAPDANNKVTYAP